MSFGPMPIANRFLLPEDFADEYFFELAPAFCDECTMVQLINQPAPDEMFNDDYAFFSGTSQHMTRHFQDFAELVCKRNLSGDDPFVVELGCNDGIMLQNFMAKGIRHLGVEPSGNVADVARKKGITVTSEFFSEDTAARIVEQHGHADAILAANVMCHIADISSVAAGVNVLLKDTGVLIFEDPYLGDVIKKTSYDQIYDEHVFVFSALSVSRAFEGCGLRLVDVMPQPTHGGSMRYVLAREGAQEPNAAVADLLDQERGMGLDKAGTFDQFRESCEKSRSNLMQVLNDLKAGGKRVVGYGATSKSTTVMNYCGITQDHIEFISDTTPIKQGKFTPGSHIPVKPHDAFKDNYPDYALLFAWNHKAEIMANEEAFAESGGKWINFVPDVSISS